MSGLRACGGCGPPGCGPGAPGAPGGGPPGCRPRTPGCGSSGGGLSWARSGLRISPTTARTDPICRFDDVAFDRAIVGYIDVSAIAGGSPLTIWLVASGLKEKNKWDKYNRMQLHFSKI